MGGDRPGRSVAARRLHRQAAQGGEEDWGLWLPHMPEEWGGMGLGPTALAAMVQAEAAQSASARSSSTARRPTKATCTRSCTGHRRAEGEVPAPLCDGIAVVLRDDRARGRRLRPDADPDPGRTRRRRLGDQRSQVVHLGRPRRAFRDPDRAHRGGPRHPAGREHRVHRRPAVGRLEHRARRPHDAGGATTARSASRTCACRTSTLGPSAAGAPARPVPARAGAPRALHALDRPGRDRARHDGRPRPEAVRARLAALREAGHPVDDRRFGLELYQAS